MTSTLTPPTRKAPLHSALDRTVAMRLAAAEYDRVLETFALFTPAQWLLPTECAGWDVRAMAGHIVGMAEMATGLREMVRQQMNATWRAKRRGGEVLDAQTANQVEEHADLSVSELVERMRTIGPKAVAGRRRTLAVLRERTLPSQLVGAQREWWTLGYLLDTILTRDPFMHRLDIARATGVLITPTAAHEGVMVDDVVREWGARHHSAYLLELTGPAGGRWESGSNGESITMDALDFCRFVSGRGTATGLLATLVPF
jgi:uncharacterized protein (TIGR03083 family)